MEKIKNKENIISIIVPVYNVETKLERCIESLINQSYSNIEILLINDGSIDKSGEICNLYSKKDKRVTVIHKENGGVSSARNIGLKNAIGKYIIFCDSDDYVDNKMCEKMLNKLLETNSELVICSYFTVYNNRIKKHECNEKKYNCIKDIEADFSNLYSDCFFNSPWNKLYIKDKIDFEFKEDMKYFEDYYFNIEYMDNIDKVCTTKDAFYYYNEDSVGSLTKVYSDDIFKVFEVIYEKQKEFLHKNWGDKFDGYISSSLIYGMYNSMQKLVYSDNLDKKSVIRTMKLWRESNQVKEALKYKNLTKYLTNLDTIQYRIAFKLLQENKIYMLYFILKCKKILIPLINVVKNNFRNREKEQYNEKNSNRYTAR